MDRYTVSWESYAGESCVVTIWDTESEGESVQELVASDTPFVTTVDDDEDPLVAVRTGQAQLGLVGSYEVLDLFQFTTGARYRVVLEVDGGVKWLGWLKGEALSQSYESAEGEIVLNCVDDVEMARSWNMAQSDWEWGEYAFSGSLEPVSLGKIICEAFARQSGKVGASVDGLKFVLPAEAMGGVWQLSTYLNRGIFFEIQEIDTEDEEATLYSPMTCYEAIEEICTAFGWTCKQEAGAVVFSTPTGWKYAGETIRYATLSFDELYNTETMVSGEAVSGAGALEVAGSHEVSVFSGVHKVEVRADLTTFDSLMDDITNGAYYISKAETDKTTRLKRWTRAILFTNPKVKCYTWEITSPSITSTAVEITAGEHSDSQFWTDLEPDKQTETDSAGTYTYINTGRVSAGLCKEDTITPSDDYQTWDFKTGIGANVQYPYYYFEPSNEYDSPVYLVKINEYNNKKVVANMPLAVIECDAVTLVSGALCFNFAIDTMDNMDRVTAQMPVALTCGSYAFNFDAVNGEGEKVGAWFENGGDPFPCWVTIDESGNLESNITLETPYSGASGIVAPITNTSLSGTLKLWFYAPIFKAQNESWRRYIIKDVTLKWVALDNWSGIEAKSKYRYRKYFSGWSEDGEVRGVKLHSMRDNQNSLGQILQKYDGIGWWAVQQIVMGGMSYKRPEVLLLEKMIAMYARSRKMLILTLKRNELSSTQTYTDGDGGEWAVLAQTDCNWRTGEARYLLVNL